jgi:hypothetical protein
MHCRSHTSFSKSSHSTVMNKTGYSFNKHPIEKSYHEWAKFKCVKMNVVVDNVLIHNVRKV